MVCTDAVQPQKAGWPLCLAVWQAFKALASARKRHYVLHEPRDNLTKASRMRTLSSFSAPHFVHKAGLGYPHAPGCAVLLITAGRPGRVSE